MILLKRERWREKNCSSKNVVQLLKSKWCSHYVPLCTDFYFVADTLRWNKSEREEKQERTFFPKRMRKRKIQSHAKETSKFILCIPFLLFFFCSVWNPLQKKSKQTTKISKWTSQTSGNKISCKRKPKRCSTSYVRKP